MARGRILQHHVGRAGEFAKDLLAFGGLEIQRNTLLAAVVSPERRLIAAEVPGPERIAALGVLDFDHFRAEIGEQRAREWPSDEVRDLEHHDSVERPCHDTSLPLSAPRGRRALLDHNGPGSRAPTGRPRSG